MTPPLTKLAAMQSRDPTPQAGCASTGEGAQLRSAGAEGWAAGRRHRGSRRGKRSKHSAVPREPGRGEGLTPGNRGVSPTGRGYVWPTRTAAPSALQWRGGDGILGACAPTVPALLMAGRAPFSAHRRFPPKGTYCWEEGRLSALSSCLRCLSRRMECTAFRKSLRLLGELWEGTGVRETARTGLRPSPGAEPPNKTLRTRVQERPPPGSKPRGAVCMAGGGAHPASLNTATPLPAL